MKGKVAMEDFEPERIKGNSTARALRGKMVISASSEYESMYPSKWGAGIEVRLKGGQTMKAATFYAKGDPEKPMSATELIDKFKDLAKAALPEEKLDSLAGRLLTLADADDLGLIS